MQTAAHPGRDDQQAKRHPEPTGKFVRKNSPSVDHSYEGVNGLLTFVSLDLRDFRDFRPFDPRTE